MNLLSLIVTTGLNLIHAPFSHNVARSDDGIEDFSVFPFNILKNTPACVTLTVAVGENHMKVTSLPRGFCSNCCQAKITRDVRFMLYTKADPKRGVPIVPFNKVGAAARAGVQPDRDTVIFIHGFSEPSPGESGTAIVDAYLSRPEYFNVILLDWSELSSFPWYRTAVENVKLVGEILRNFIKTFTKSGEIAIDRLHVIGFSLGSHIASRAGKNLQGGVRIPRITALDPAFPDFPLQDRTKRLAETDADYIDVIHTDSGIFGFPLSIGHADFYPNGGRALQPGCQPSYLAKQRIIDQVLACSHVRAWRLYAESVRNPDAFPATQCRMFRGPAKECNFTTDAYMGYRSNKNYVGQFYLRTDYKAPYGLKPEVQEVYPAAN
ncbi:phospholipase A1 VesT1.02-like [Cylas formicarius]|uniref:phospholipase A1 VesT1.02-like n=1 Tax=Cylas formicarius TaxID=197179 RepID=UPI002958BE18|nr:phospholipase A1 VesT1.02-like [Cylas formicarius]